MGSACSTNGGRGTHGILVGKPEGKRSLGTIGCNWVDDHNIDLRELERQDRVV
jgi:hypothetical protein